MSIKINLKMFQIAPSIITVRMFRKLDNIQLYTPIIITLYDIFFKLRNL